MGSEGGSGALAFFSTVGASEQAVSKITAKVRDQIRIYFNVDGCEPYCQLHGSGDWESAVGDSPLLSTSHCPLPFPARSIIGADGEATGMYGSRIPKLMAGSLIAAALLAAQGDRK